MGRAEPGMEGVQAPIGRGYKRAIVLAGLPGVAGLDERQGFSQGTSGCRHSPTASA
jgi:hypothetical protein